MANETRMIRYLIASQRSGTILVNALGSWLEKTHQTRSALALDPSVSHNRSLLQNDMPLSLEHVGTLLLEHDGTVLHLHDKVGFKSKMRVVRTRRC